VRGARKAVRVEKPEGGGQRPPAAAAEWAMGAKGAKGAMQRYRDAATQRGGGTGGRGDGAAGGVWQCAATCGGE